jgi:hypothetical protein
MTVLTFITLATAATPAPAAGPKSDPNPDWRCQIVFRDAAFDAIQSDGATYRDGEDDVSCVIINEPGTVRDGWLHMKPTRSHRQPGPRSLNFIGQTYLQPSGTTASYPSFVSHGILEVLELGKIVWDPDDPTFRDVLWFRSYLRHRQLPFADGIADLNGDSSYAGNIDFDSTSSVFVQALDPCSWQVTSYTTEEPNLFVSARGERASTRTAPRVMRLIEGSRTQTVRGDFPMAFQFTVKVIGNKPGC